MFEQKQTWLACIGAALVTATLIGAPGGGGPIGACCYLDGTCDDGVEEIICLKLCGTFYEDMSCANIDCFQFGACCLPDGTCDDGYIRSTCECEGGVFHAGLICADMPCGGGQDPDGSCCLPDGNCLDNVTEATCLQANGSWTENGLCIFEQCDEDAGACCLPDGSCVDGTSQIECALILEGVWHETLSCADVDCGGTPCPCDFDGNNLVDVSDMLFLLGNWGAGNATGDCTGDGNTDVADVLALLADWGIC